MSLDHDEILRLAQRHAEDGMAGLLVRDTIPALVDEAKGYRSALTKARHTVAALFERTQIQTLRQLTREIDAALADSPTT